LVIPAMGTHGGERLLIAVAAIAGFCVIPGRIVLKSAALLIAGVLAWLAPGVPWGVIAHGRQLADKTGPGNLVYVTEGMDSSIAVSDLDSVRTFHVSGKVEASNNADDMRMERMLGHVPALLHPKPRNVLVVGCGAGVTAGSFVPYPEIERI